jgi:hypothetical protein
VESGNINSAHLEEVSMNMYIAVTWLLLCGSASTQTKNGSQTSPPEQRADQQQSAPALSPATQPQKIDPARAADIRQLLDVVGTKALMSQMMDTMVDDIKPLLAKALPPGEYRERLIDLFFVKFKSKADPQQLVESIVPLYDKYLSAEEIKGLIQFYQTPLGQKTVTVIPKVMAESQEQGRKWGEELGRESMIEVLTEHPELKKAMEDAGKAPAPE